MRGCKKEQLNIAMFGHKRIPSREGGVEVVVQALSTRMAKLGHHVTCYNRGGRPVCGPGRDGRVSDSYEGVRLKTVWTLDKKGLAAVTSSFFAALRAAVGNADVVHIHGEGPAFMCWLPKLFGKRVVVTVHGLDWQRKKWANGFGAKYILAGEKMAARLADAIIVLSRSAQQYFQRTYGRETVWIPNGVSKPECRAPEEIGRQFGLNKDDYILYLGRLVPEKGAHYLIEAFSGVRTDKKLVIAGGTSDTPDYGEMLKTMAKGDARILFTGFIQGRILEELYSNAYVYVLPSELEGMPLSLLEAMSYGNCCLVSDIPECREVVENKAVLFAKNDVEDLRNCLQAFCNDPALTAEWKAHSRSYTCDKYNWDVVTQKTMELYR